MINDVFPYRPNLDDLIRKYRHYVRIPAKNIAHEWRSLWIPSCFRVGFLDWVKANIEGDCFYTTMDTVTAPDRFLIIAYFEDERDATIFKLFWS